tara:strand:+ start:251 stop:541 length:291 start_codon:yes stop_codon:yes gene_type:complete
VNRKQRRAASAARRKAIGKAKKSNTDVGEKMALFGHLPDACTVCNEPFDKTDREMVSTWHVAVREAQEEVNLYCPPCWTKALEVVKMIQEEMENGE